jgi:hypothetical protein
VAGYYYPNGQLYRFSLDISGEEALSGKLLFQYDSDEKTIWVLGVWFARKWII